MRPGTVMSLFNTSTGLVFAAYMESKFIEGMIETEHFRFGGSPQHTLKRPWQEVEALLSEVRQVGQARSIGLTVPGMNAISSPVFNHVRRLSLVMTIMGPAGTFDPSLEAEVAQRLRSCAAQISAELGYRE
nr:IclR family transcriptional regulator C-terminal domain-containing protein [Chelativorans sp. J32]